MNYQLNSKFVLGSLVLTELGMNEWRAMHKTMIKLYDQGLWLIQLIQSQGSRKENKNWST